MIEIRVEDWILLYGGAIVAIAFSFLASLTVSLLIRVQELEIRIKESEIDNKNVLKTELETKLSETKRAFNSVRMSFVIFLAIVGLFIVVSFLFAPSTQSTQPSTNNTYIYQNCSNQTNIENITNYYNLTEIKYINNQPPSLKELKIFMRSKQK